MISEFIRLRATLANSEDAAKRIFICELPDPEAENDDWLDCGTVRVWAETA